MYGSDKLGFGMMRLPQLSGEATDIDFEQVSRMVDHFLAAGFTYFDTSWAYHNTASETAALITSVTQKAFHTPAAPNSRLSRKAAGRMTTT